MRRIFIIAALLLLPVICLVAQQYPVQVTPQLLPPYSLQVSDYTSAVGSPKLNLLLLLRDFNKPSLQVRLRMSITSQSVAITTREDVAFTAIEILSGQPKYIQPADLTEYFNSNNLTFSGITRSQYEQTGKLPEGFYTFCFEVVDIVTGQTVSNKGCTVAWLTLSEPPLLNLPRKAEALIPVVEPSVQNVIFQWTPRHTSSPTAAYTIEYNFKLVELPLGTTTPEADFASYPAIYEENTTLTTLLYDGIGSKPRLKPGYKYAWQVQAIAKNGTQDVAMFRNNGFSEIFWFDYQNNCPAPTNINATAQGQRVSITWGSDVQHLDYKVEYRKANTAGAEWFELSNTTPNVSITDLDPSTLYEYRIGAACETGKYIFSTIHQFTTNSATATTVPQCGFDPNPAPTTEPLLQQLHVGDIVKAGDFDVVVTQVSGSGSFNGQGYVVVPWLAKMKLGVRFENIGVATDLKLKAGEIITTYDPTEEGIVSIDTLFDEFKSLTGVIKALISMDVDNNVEYFNKLKESFYKVVDEEVSAEMKSEFKALVDSMDYYKNEFDDARNQYDQLPEGAEKDLQQQRMNNAKDVFERKQDELNNLNTERERLVTATTDLFIQSVKELNAETKNSFGTAPQEYNTQRQVVSQAVYDDQELPITADADEGFILKGVYKEEIDSVNVPLELKGFAESVRQLTLKRNNLKILSYIKALEKYYVQENKRDKLKDDTILEGVAMIKDILTRKKNNESDSSIKEYIKNYIKEKILTL